METWLAFLHLLGIDKDVPDELAYFARLMHVQFVDGVENPEIPMLAAIFDLKVEGKVFDVQFFPGASGTWMITLLNRSAILGTSVQQVFQSCVNQGLLEPLT